MMSMSNAQGAAAKIFEIIESEPTINSVSEAGLQPETVQGTIEFRNVSFAYPTRPDVTVLKNFNATIPSGNTIAFVGASGSGKSTCVQLIQRFYDPVEGQVFLDGHNLRDLNVRWLRQQIGIVSQEPILFGRSIYENVALGGLDNNGSRDELPSREKVEEACKLANANE